MDDDQQLSGHEGHDHSPGGCQEALSSLYTFLDGELDQGRRAAIEHHLDECSPCLEAFDFEAELRIVIAPKCTEQVPESLKARLLDMFDSAAPDLVDDEPS